MVLSIPVKAAPFVAQPSQEASPPRSKKNFAAGSPEN
jgi:hypothetical protein